MKFYCGICNVSDCWPFARVMVSINRLRNRKGSFRVNDWILDSGAFTELTSYGKYRHEPEEYAEQIKRWATNGNLQIATTQDYMCESFVLEKTGLSISEHQDLTIERFLRIKNHVNSVDIMPVLQGFSVSDYVTHIKKYGKIIKHGSWVGVGSVCKRNSDPVVIEDILMAIKSERPDIKLHGFGLKLTAFSSQIVKGCLYSADSMAWSFDGRMEKGEKSLAHDPRQALKYCAKVQKKINEEQYHQPILFDWWK